ncbi:MAG: class I SAM-dependent methyltransferase [Nitrospira sp.]
MKPNNTNNASIDYRESHIGKDKGQSYHAMFLNDPYRNMVWNFEKQILDRILDLFYRDVEIRHLDFACGTGRILHYLSARTNESVGVDLSPSMLDVARSTNTASEIIEADLTNNDVLGTRKFNLITAFRFFPNAQPMLRRQVIQILVKHLSDDGYLIINNHRNTGSLRNKLAKLLGRHNNDGMSLSEVDSLIGENNLLVKEIYPLCLFPSSENRLLMPIFLLRPTEAILSRFRPLRYFGDNLIFVCKRS